MQLGYLRQSEPIARPSIRPHYSIQQCACKTPAAACAFNTITGSHIIAVTRRYIGLDCGGGEQFSHDKLSAVMGGKSAGIEQLPQDKPSVVMYVLCGSLGIWGTLQQDRLQLPPSTTSSSKTLPTSDRD